MIENLSIMLQRQFDIPHPDKEIQAVMGIMKLRNTRKFEEQNIKFKKSPFQIKVLEKIFKITNFPSSSTRKDLSLLLCMPEKSIQVWFQNARQAIKRTKTFSEGENSEIYNIPVSQILEIMKNVKKSLGY